MTTENKSLAGLHHVTAITADAQKNIDFYCGVLGLRLVKLTVNFDDPSSYHLYYGDESGRPDHDLLRVARCAAQPRRPAPSDGNCLCGTGELPRLLGLPVATAQRFASRPA